MDFLVKLLEWIKTLPIWARSIILLVVSLICAVFFFTSCSSTRAVIRNPANTAVSTITVSVTNPQSVEVSPSVDSTRLNLEFRK